MKKFLIEALQVILGIFVALAGTIVASVILFKLALGFLYCVGWTFEQFKEPPTVYEYQLSEIEDDVYGIHITTTSRAPAYNYEMISVNINDQIYTIKGNVNVHYVDGEPRLVWTDTNYVNSDTADLYVPKGTIRYDGVINID